MLPKLCPLKLTQPKPTLVSAAGGPSDARTCEGEACMAFIQFSENGRITGGNCGIVVAFVSMMNLEQRAAALTAVVAKVGGLESHPAPAAPTPNA